MTNIIIRACKERTDYIKQIVNHIPDAIIVWDQCGNAMETFYRALEAAGDAPVIHMEDDVLLAENFRAKAESIIAVHCNEVVQMFSMRKKDIAIGSRREPGRTFLMGQCFYVPQYLSADIRAYAGNWSRHQEHPTGLDTMVSDYLRKNRLQYWLHVPSLVQHRECISLIDSRRSKYRQSPTFQANKTHE